MVDTSPNHYQLEMEPEAKDRQGRACGHRTREGLPGCWLLGQGPSPAHLFPECLSLGSPLELELLGPPHQNLCHPRPPGHALGWERTWQAPSNPDAWLALISSLVMGIDR